MPTRTTVSLTARFINAACWLISGIVLIAFGASSSSGVWAVLIGLAVGAYGVYVAATRRSYFVSSVTDFLPIVAIAIGVAALQ